MIGRELCRNLVTEMDVVGVSAPGPAVRGVLEEPQGLRRSLRAQTKSAAAKRVLSPYFAKKPGGAGKGAKRSVAISTKAEAGSVPFASFHISISFLFGKFGEKLMEFRCTLPPGTAAIQRR